MNKEIVQAVLERSNGLCEVCGREGTELHHIIFGSGCRKVHEEISSIILLCSECHRGTYGVHGREGKKLDLKLKRKLQQIYYNQGLIDSEVRKKMGGRLY